MIRRFLGAVQFLTVIPIHGSTGSPGHSAVFFPAIGALLGVVSGGLLQIAGRPFGSSLAALIALTVVILLSGGLHEDGLADCADALRAGRTRERMLAILKDSRIGVYGALALIIVLAIRWQALTRLSSHPVLAVAGILAMSRGSMVLLASITPRAGEGLGASFAADVSRGTTVLVALQVIAASVLCGWRSLPVLVVTLGTVVAAKAYFTHRLGGITGDCLGATCSVVEAANFLVLAWQPSI